MRRDLFTAGTPGFRLGLLCALSALALSASAAGYKSGVAPVAAAGTSAQNEPVSRFIIRYKTGVKMAGQGGATPATERLEAAAQVMRSANLAGNSQLQYLKSVSSQLHVAHLEQAVSPAEAQQLMQRLRADAAVEDVVIDRRAKPHLVPNDPFFSTGSPNNQWHLQPSSFVAGGINAANAWDIATGANTVVAVLDGGYRPHADLVANVLPGYDFISADLPSRFGGQSFWTSNDGDARDSDARDPGDWVTNADVAAGFCDVAEPQSSWHGTHVAGILAAAGNNAAGGLGVAFGARLLPVRVLGRCGGYTSDIMAGARWAAGLPVTGVPPNAHPAKVLNLSLGVSGACDSITQAVVDEIRASNVSIVASSGNEGLASITAPANCKGVVAVTAHTREGDSADYANVGPGTSISAPGGGNNTVLFSAGGVPRGIFSTANTGFTGPVADDYLEYQGTSMAAPQMAGVLALLASAPAAAPFKMATLEGLVRGAARPFPPGGYCSNNPDGLATGFCGSGLLDAQAAMAALSSASASSADLEVIHHLPTSEVAPGQTFTFSVKAVNWGPLSSSNVRLMQSVGPGILIQSVTGSAGAVVSRDATGAVATLPSLAVGSALTLNVTAVVTASGGDIHSSATASSDSPDPAPVNNTDVQVISVVTPPAPAAGGGGGCTVAADGRSDAGLVLLALGALLMMAWRRRRAAGQGVRPVSAP